MVSLVLPQARLSQILGLQVCGDRRKGPPECEMRNGEEEMADGKWRMADDKWRVGDGGWGMGDEK
jgi:hypothetical protein